MKQQFTSYAFAKDGYPRLYPYTSSFTDAAARAPRRDFEDVEIPLPGAPAASASIAANATVALAAGLALTGPPVWVAVEASGDCLAMVNQRSLLDFRAIDLNTLSITKGHVTFKHRNGREVFLNYGDDETASSREAFIRARVQACRAKPLTLANVPAPLRYGAQPILDYGSVAEEFSPPMPTDASREYTVKMTKERPGSLYELRIGHIGLFTTWSGHDMQNQRRWGSAVVSLLSEDVGELYTLMRTGPTAGQQVIGCWYDGEGPRFFWYKERPAMADPARLKTRVPNHPFLEIGAPRDKCPASWAEAR